VKTLTPCQGQTQPAARSPVTRCVPFPTADGHSDGGHRPPQEGGPHAALPTRCWAAGGVRHDRRLRQPHPGAASAKRWTRSGERRPARSSPPGGRHRGLPPC